MSSLTLTLGAKNREKENNLRKRIEENEKRTKSTSCNSDSIDQIVDYDSS